MRTEHIEQAQADLLIFAYKLRLIDMKLLNELIDLLQVKLIIRERLTLPKLFESYREKE